MRNGAVFAACVAFQRGIVFLLLPVYTRVLDPDSYGRLSVLLAIAGVAIILLSFGMDTAFFRTYFALRRDAERQVRFVTTAWVFLLVVPPVAALLAALVGAVTLTGSGVVPPGQLALALAGAAIFVSATVVPLALLRAEERLRDFVVLAVITGLTTAAFTLVGVVILRAGVGGWLVGVLAANAVTLVVAARMVPLRLHVGLDRGLLRGALALGLPLVPHAVSHWGLAISNRVVLTELVSPAHVGQYALAANIALPLAIVFQSMGNAFMATYARASTEAAARAALPRVVLVQFLLVLFISVIGTLLAPFAVPFLAPPEYASAVRVVPWITAGYGLLGLYFVPMNAVSQTVGRTGKVWLVTLLAAAANLGSLLVLVGPFGLVGAGAATTFGYFVLLLGLWIYSRGRDNPVRYEWQRLGRGALVFVIVYCAAIETSGVQTVVDGCIRLAWMAAVPPLLVLLRVLDHGDLGRVLGWRVISKGASNAP